MNLSRRACVFAITLLLGRAAQCAPPDLGPNVVVLDPSMSSAAVQQRVDAVFATQERSQFGADRTALLFMPGTYAATVRVGFYTQLLGLGSSPDDVQINGGIRVDAAWMNGNATCNFWRSAENLSVRPTNGSMLWAVSQGTALRRVHVRGGINLWDNGWSSGGYLADSLIDGAITSGSQQQWFSRNSDWGEWRGGVWNMVFVGTAPPPPGRWPSPAYTTVDRTPVVREKPCLAVDGTGAWSVRVPKLATEMRGRSWPNGAVRSIPLDHFHVARAGRDSAATINAALAAGQDLLLTPGAYHLDAAIHVTRPGTVVLGLGYATLVPDRGTAAVTVDDVDGVTVGGLIFDAGAQGSPALLMVGPTGATASHAADPTCLFDIVARAGGAAAGRCESFVTINANHVIGDNLWLWRADHGAGAGWETNPVANGLVVNGGDVTMYGLFVEHCQRYQTLWNGERGRTYFYQSELPYDVPSQAAWAHDGVRGYASYKVADGVKDHDARGLSIYSFFTAAPVVADSAIAVPTTPDVRVRHVTTIRLGGTDGSGIAHGVNGRGGPVIKQFEAQTE